ncbi:MAG TPA: type IV pilus twitching motility protein PilT [Actinomycetota bacterium]|nr:type IV pilus twitching motility protein PilT [Actinomycetota bacterium]
MTDKRPTYGSPGDGSSAVPTGGNAFAAQAPADPNEGAGPLWDEPVLVESAVEAEEAQREGNPGQLADLLMSMIDLNASDLHLSAGNPPLLRLRGELVRTEYDRMKPPEIQRMIYAILTQKQREVFEEHLELDLSYSLPGIARFRVNVYKQRDALGAAFRLIPFEIKTLEDLRVPLQVAQFAKIPRGLVLVTGPTGSGKSTTLAALIDIINSQEAMHIMTVEDPIEFLHQHKKSAVHQREIGGDTHSFSEALRHVLRQDPDVILVGEMRDLETIQMAITAAETGHLVFGTLHTNSAPSSVDRIIDVFPPHQQQQIRVQLASSLQGVVTQTLVPTADGVDRAVAAEILVVTPAVSNLIREQKTHQIYSSMQSGGSIGMQTMDKALADLVKGGRVKRQDAEERAQDVENFRQLLRTMGIA